MTTNNNSELRVIAAINEATKSLCSTMFDTLAKDSPRLYEHFMSKACATVAAEDGIGDQSQVAVKAREETPEGLALKARVLVVAREKFVDSCKVAATHGRPHLPVSRIDHEINLGKAREAFASTKHTAKGFPMPDEWMGEN